ncbi:outer membrane protein assembly factor BamA [Rhizobium sp. NRK18]|uniref:outer membrane protein assembly factor BamA n=1 Tax=Rhizobium sp. NRK18 TaxID=2964667 RepID=UPI0021C3B600|nr:outer membrane protein assembly factor BamA [Rhizobium sp. NRK18]MCQ2004298.1 outer membrane protein assembly factor BamA [Rhizobium sp. NRK18]
MKAGSKFLNAVSAVALSTSLVVTGTAAVVIASATVAEAAVVKNIVVRGAGRVGADTVRSNLTIKPGKSFSNADIDQSIKNLYATGYFSNVSISVSGSSLVVNVAEGQLVNQVVFNGNRKIKDEKLAASVQTKPLGPYNQVMIESDIQTIKDAYASIGRSDVTVTTQTFDVGEGRLNVAFVINEGDRTKIDQINFVGNHAFSDGRLAAIINTKKSNFLSFLTRRDVYNPDKLKADEAELRKFYYNHGYADFRVVSSDAVLDEASNTYTITFTVDEGEKYNFGAVNVESSVEGVDPATLQSLVESRSGKTYSADDVQKTMEAIAAKVASEGYPFARVTPRGDRDFANNTIGVSYLIDQGERAYIERIEIRGNTRTRDYVIRREFDISEGDAFNRELISRAKRRLEALGYFTSVDITTQPGSEPDRVVVVVNVEDQPTGSFGVGAGYAAGGDGVMLEASIEEKNFLGRGQYIKVAAGAGTQGARTYSLSFTEPYFLGYRLAAGFDIFKSESNGGDNYDYQEQGFTLRVTAPITEDLKTTFAYNFKQMKYDASSSDYADLSQPYQDLVDKSPWTKSSISNTIVYNTIDDMQMPHEGIYASVTNEVAGLGGDSQFYKISGKAKMFYTVSDYADVVASIGGTAGYVAPLGGNLNVFDQFQIGGKEIRGFENNGIGPRMPNGDALGGTTYITASAEASFPLPGIPTDLNLRGAVFADAGTLFGNEVSGASGAEGTNASLRASVGLGIVWGSPFGAIRFDYAVPVLKEDFDKTQNFRFGIANQF